MCFRNIVTAAREKLTLKSQGSGAQLKQILISTTVTLNFIIFNKTSSSKPLLILNKKFCMKEMKSDWFVISEDAEI